MRKILFLIFLVLVGCDKPTDFSRDALQEKLVNTNQQELIFKNILTKHKGNKILIDVWASWCKDCIVTLPDLKKIQDKNPDVHFVFLSLDKSLKRWKRAIEHFQIVGDHYFMIEGKNGVLGDFLGLWWIPRYIVVNESGAITLFKSTKITDKNILEAFKK